MTQYECSQCGRTDFNARVHLINHWKKNHSEFKFKIDGPAGRVVLVANGPAANLPAERWTCGVCGRKSFTSYKDVETHFKERHVGRTMASQSLSRIVNEVRPLDPEEGVMVPLMGHPYSGAKWMKGIVGDRDAVVYQETFGNWKILVGRNNDTTGGNESFMFRADDRVTEPVMLKILEQWDGYGQPLGWYRWLCRDNEPVKRDPNLIATELWEILLDVGLTDPPESSIGEVFGMIDPLEAISANGATLIIAPSHSRAQWFLQDGVKPPQNWRDKKFLIVTSGIDAEKKLSGIRPDETKDRVVILDWPNSQTTCERIRAIMKLHGWDNCKTWLSPPKA